MNLKTKQWHFDKAVRMLGGVTSVAELTDSSLASVCNWRARGWFPSAQVDVIRPKLWCQGYDVPPELFNLKKIERDVAA